VKIGRYEVIRELKAGGMGTVTLCRAPDDSVVVLKRPHSPDAQAAVRLRDEARLGARLLHPGIVETLDLFEEGGQPVLVVAFVDGPSLELLRGLGPLPAPAVARVGRQIADALDALHNADDESGRPLEILHRDVTPGNIVIGKDGDARLIDLGIARFDERQAERTQEGFIRGTMRYIAPELLAGDDYSPASDLWSLGIVLWEAAIGRFAYGGETDREVLAGIVGGEPMKLRDGEVVDPPLVDAIRPLLQPMLPRRSRRAFEAAARFSALEELYGDTQEATQEAMASALRKLESSSPRVPISVGGVAIGNDFDDNVATAAEQADMGELEAGYDLPHPDPRSEQQTQDPFEPEPTLASPAPVDFASNNAGERDGDEEAPDERSLSFSVPVPTLPRSIYNSDEGEAVDDFGEATQVDAAPPSPAPASPPALEIPEVTSVDASPPTHAPTPADELPEIELPELTSVDASPPAAAEARAAPPALASELADMGEQNTMAGLTPAPMERVHLKGGPHDELTRNARGPSDGAPRAVARIALKKKAMRNGVLQDVPQTDQGDEARRQEQAMSDPGVSPFDEATEVAPPPASALDRAVTNTKVAAAEELARVQAAIRARSGFGEPTEQIEPLAHELDRPVTSTQVASPEEIAALRARARGDTPFATPPKTLPPPELAPPDQPTAPVEALASESAGTSPSDELPALFPTDTAQMPAPSFDSQDISSVDGAPVGSHAKAKRRLRKAKRDSLPLPELVPTNEPLADLPPTHVDEPTDAPARPNQLRAGVPLLADPASTFGDPEHSSRSTPSSDPKEPAFEKGAVVNVSDMASLLDDD
jgi:serine/threonine protein kinase